MNYPDFELIFSVSSPSDPAYAKLILGEISLGANPKVNNLILGYEQAKSNLILISDSNIRVEKNHLKRLVAHLSPGTGIVTSIVSGSQPPPV